MSASPEQPTPSTARSRRAVLAGALGGIGAWAAAAVGSRTRVRAADGDPMVVGGEYTATSVTLLQNTTTTDTVFRAESTSGIGVWATSTSQNAIVGVATGLGGGVSGQSQSGPGVYGLSQAQDGVRGATQSDAFSGVRGLSQNGGTGVTGYSGPGTVFGSPGAGVYGRADLDASSRGVLGESPAGNAVRGESASGVGVFAVSETGYAVRSSGRVRMDRVSGVASIPAGSTSVTVSPGVNVVSSSFVLLTPKANIGSRGLWFTTNATADTFTIRMSSSRGSATKVAWLLVG